MKILIVEDEALLAMSYKMTLDMGNCEVVGIAATAQEAIDISREKRPDVVLMDIKLQGKLDGIEAAKEIIDSFSIPIIFLTGNADEKTRTRALSVKPIAYLEKPINCDLLYAELCVEGNMNI